MTETRSFRPPRNGPSLLTLLDLEIVAESPKLFSCAPGFGDLAAERSYIFFSSTCQPSYGFILKFRHMVPFFVTGISDWTSVYDFWSGPKAKLCTTSWGRATQHASYPLGGHICVGMYHEVN